MKFIMDNTDKKEIAVNTPITEENAFSVIKDMVNDNKLLLFMKGIPTLPMCGFSARIVEILEQTNLDYKTYNVLSNPIIRESVKKFSNWPTIPQLYFNQEFIGGCDIITDMHTSGELDSLLKS